jgi:hypothetical protein
VSQHALPSFPDQPFGLLLVEGGDERGACENVAGPTTWAGLVCWYQHGRDNLPNLAGVATLAPNFRHARSIGVVLDVEDDLDKALDLASRTLAVFGATGTPAHGVVSAGSPRLGMFLSPDGSSQGSIETLCRHAVRDATLAKCVDALVGCAGHPHASQRNAQVAADKGWLKAYLSMLPDPSLRFHQAFSTPGGIDPAHEAFDPLRSFLGSL